jgi:hypothetical protein
MSFEEITRAQVRRRSNGISYSLMKSGHANIYFLAGFVPNINFPTNTWVTFLVDHDSKLVALKFSAAETNNSYKMLRKQKDGATGQLFTSGRKPARMLLLMEYPEKELIKLEKQDDIWLLKKENNEDTR